MSECDTDACPLEAMFLVTPHFRDEPPSVRCATHACPPPGVQTAIIELLEPDEYQPTDLWTDELRPEWERVPLAG